MTHRSHVLDIQILTAFFNSIATTVDN